MKRQAWKTVTTLMVFVGVAVTGCACGEQEGAQIAALTHQNEVLMTQNRDCQEQIQELTRINDQLQGDIDARDAELASKNQTIVELRQKIDEKPAVKEVTVVADDWVATPFGDKVSVGSDVLFSPGKASLTNQGRTKLASIARDLKTTYDGLPVRVYGYTDTDPIKKTKNLWQDNLDLSANRAMAVTRYLREQGVQAQRIETVAMGETNPVASNKTRAGKAQNRRVEIMVIK